METSTLCLTCSSTRRPASGIGKGLSLVVYGLNLTNEVFGYYQGSPIFVNQREFYKSDYAGGFRYTFNREK